MKFGLLYELEMPKPWDPKKEREIFHEALEQIVLAEEMGFEYVWMVEHHFLTEFAHSSAPEVFLGALTQRTSKMRLGHGVVLLPVNHPIRVAEYVATLDIMSNGRVEFGTGRSGTPYQLTPFGAELKDSRPMWEEALDIIPRMWTEEVFSHMGTYYDISPREIIPKPVQDPHPPIWVAASQVETFKMAGEKGIGTLCFTLGDPEQLGERVDTYKDAIKTAKPVGKFVNDHIGGFTVAYCDENNKKGREIALEAGNGTWVPQPSATPTNGPAWTRPRFPRTTNTITLTCASAQRRSAMGSRWLPETRTRKRCWTTAPSAAAIRMPASVPLRSTSPRGSISSCPSFRQATSPTTRS